MMGQPIHRGEYPENWPAIAMAVKDSAAWRCVRCTHDHDPPAGRCLTVHHFDGNKSNVELWNLMPLCQACHLSVQARVNPEIGLIFTPSIWAMPYIAGFYEAGFGVPGPLYNLRAWMAAYIAVKIEWPSWAPRQQKENA